MQKISLVEDHHQVLNIWRERKFKNCTLIHIDAHIDFDFYRALPLPQVVAEAKNIDDLKTKFIRSLRYRKYKKDFESQLNIGNFIYSAMRENIVRCFYWILPGDKKEFKDCYGFLRNMVKALKSQDPFEDKEINESTESLKTRLYDNYLEATVLFHCKKINKPVLLDIDLDYLLFSSIKSAALTEGGETRSPWMYPDALARLIKEKFTNVVYTTIAYSVNGGFTPIEYKFLGDELSLRLSRKELSPDLERTFCLRNKALKEYFRKQRYLSKRNFRKALFSLNNVKSIDDKIRSEFKAHLFFWLFKLHWESKEYRTARYYYKKTLFCDASYRVKENNYAYLYTAKGNHGFAIREFRKILYCDPYNKFALCGLACIFLKTKEPIRAKTLLIKALRMEPFDKEVLARVTEICLNQGDLKSAERFLSSLRRVDGGYRRMLLDAKLNVRKGNVKRGLDLYEKVLLMSINNLDMYKSIFEILKNKEHPKKPFFIKKYRLFRTHLLTTNRSLMRDDNHAQPSTLMRDLNYLDCLLNQKRAAS